MSLSKSIDKYLKRKLASFHSPAHGGKNNLRDLSELSGLDDLQYPETCIAKSQELIADLFGAAKSFMLVNGASVGLMAALLALRMQLEANHKPVLLARNVHKSVISGAILADLNIEWLEPEWLSAIGTYGRVYIETKSSTPNKAIPASKNSKSNIDYINENYSAIVLTNPSYEGVFSQLNSVSEFLKIPLIVDEAHGAHFKFSATLPLTAMKYGAKISVQSWHKCLGSVTQTGVLHISSQSRINSEFVASALRLLQSTSPSYLLMESLSSTAELFASKGEAIIKNALDKAQEINFPLFNNDDPLRANFYFENHPLSGSYILETFESEGIALEKASENAVLAFINLYNANIKKLNNAYSKINARLEKTIDQTNYKQARRIEQNCPKPIWTEQILKPRDAYLGSNIDCKINTELKAPCPPGIATLIPGQTLLNC